jgi:hypothetical protein
MANAVYKKLHSWNDIAMQPRRSCIRTVICRPRLQSSMVRESNRDKDVTTELVYPPRGREVSVSDLSVSGYSGLIGGEPCDGCPATVDRIFRHGR